MQAYLNLQVQQVIDERVESGAEVGVQVAAYIDGALAVDAWAGVADETTGRLVDGTTLFTSWSTTKGFVATCLHILVDRERVDYDAPVAAYWPAFAAHGKAATTIRQAITHQAGIPQMPHGVTPEMMTDWEAMCAAIADHAPLWTPGTRPCYHWWTFGWIIGEIIHRVDGRPIAQFAREELCRPLGIADFYLGIPDSVEPRVARLRQAPLPATAESAPSDLALRVAPPQVTTADVANRPDVRRAAIPAAGGIMSARAIARHYAMLAGGGMLDGTRLLSPERVDMLRALQTDAPDELFGGPNRKALGYMLGGAPHAGGDMAMGHSGGEFGHRGFGGSIGFADPARGLAVGVTKTLMTVRNDPTNDTAYVVAEVIRQHLDAGFSLGRTQPS
ncbi:MAG: serine hydrolase domain-containing protein [Herpetosiphon sp.]